MGFIDILKSAIDFAAEQGQKRQQEYNRYREIYDRYDTNKLVNYYKSSSGTKRMAIASILRERGCNPNDN